MSDDCLCASCQGDGDNVPPYEELRERLQQNTPPVTKWGSPPTYWLMSEEDWRRGHALVERQRACIDELVQMAGYLPEAYAVLEKHGLR